MPTLIAGEQNEDWMAKGNELLLDGSTNEWMSGARAASALSVLDTGVPLLLTEVMYFNVVARSRRGSGGV